MSKRVEMLPASAFIGAPHFSDGGKVGRPSILHDGEVVLNEAQQSNLADSLRRPTDITTPRAPQNYADNAGAAKSGGSSTMPQTQVTVHGAPAGHDTEVKETRRRDGGVSLEIQMKRAVKKMVSDGELDKSFQRYGMRPGTISR